MYKQQITVTLEVVTPLFVGGVKPRKQPNAKSRGQPPELRPPSIKGALRMWWRALYGGTQPHITPRQLAAKESEVFGNTEKASPIAIRLHTPKKYPSPRIWKPEQYFGIDYLFFAFRETNREDPRQGFWPSLKFDLILQTRLGAPNSQDAYKQACAALWLWVWFGALGARSRRGAGCLRALNNPEHWPKDLPNLVITSKDPVEFIKECKINLKTLYDAFGWACPPVDDVPPANFNILHPKAAHIYLLGRTFSSWEKGLDLLGTKYQEFRSLHQPDYDNVKAAVSGHRNQIEPVERAAFGLPIIFYYRSLDGQKGTLTGETTDRRSSPLTFHVTKLASNKYMLSLIYFRSQLLPSDTELVLSKNKHFNFAITDVPDDGLVGLFIVKISRRKMNKEPNEFFIAPRVPIPFPQREEQT